MEQTSQDANLRMAMLTYRLVKGYGVDIVVAEQIEYFIERGYTVDLVLFEQDDYYRHLKRYLQNGSLRVHHVSGTDEGNELVKKLKVDIAIAHTPPMYSMLPLFSAGTCKVFHDYGEPPVDLFPNAARRQVVNDEKIKVAKECDLRVSISQFIGTDSGIENVVPNWLGNDHLQKRRRDILELSGNFRAESGLSDIFIVCNVTRYFEPERNYKGVDAYIEVKDALYAKHPELRGKIQFVLIGRSNKEDREWARSEGVLAFSNFSEDEMISVYTDSDFYLSTSQWEGYNLGIGQALSFGMHAAATNIGAHPEFGIPISNDPAELADYVYQSYCQQRDKPRSRWTDRYRKSRLFPWKDSLVRFEKLVLDTMLEGNEVAELSPQHLSIAEAKREEISLLEKPPANKPDFSFLILNREKPEMLLPCINSIEQYCKSSYEIIIGDTGSQGGEIWNFYLNTRHQVVHLGFYHFSIGNNILAEKASGKYLVLINNDVEIVKSDFPAILEYAESQKNLGSIGAYLIFPDRKIQHAGVRICPTKPYRGIPEHFDKLQPIDSYPNRDKIRHVVSVTGAFMIIKSERYQSMGGLDEIYKEEAQDIDLCMKMRKLNLDNIVHPELLAIHYEGTTRVAKESPHDRTIFLERYGGFIENEVYAWQEGKGL